MNHLIILFILACLCSFQKSYTDATISFFFQPYPYTHESTLQRLAKPGKAAKFIVEGITNHNPVSGIFVAYAGHLDTSDANGLVIFPRRDTQPLPLIHIVITSKIIPIAMAHNTINHWELDKDTPAQFFLVEKKSEKKEESKTEIFYMDVTKEERPIDNIIPKESIIIIAKPDTIYLPTGSTIIQDQINLVLPDIYVKKGLNYIGNTLYMMKISNLFSPIRTVYKKDNMQYSSHTIFY